MIESILRKFGGWILSIFLFLTMMFVVFKMSFKNGKLTQAADNEKQRTEENEQFAINQIEGNKKANEIEIETIQKAISVRDNIVKLNAGDASKQLRDKWTRD